MTARNCDSWPCFLFGGHQKVWRAVARWLWSARPDVSPRAQNGELDDLIIDYDIVYTVEGCFVDTEHRDLKGDVIHMGADASEEASLAVLSDCPRRWASLDAVVDRDLRPGRIQNAGIQQNNSWSRFPWQQEQTMRKIAQIQKTAHPVTRTYRRQGKRHRSPTGHPRVSDRDR